MKTPSDVDFRSAYAVFDRRHNQQRAKLLAKLDTLPVSMNLVATRYQHFLRSPLGMGLTAACLILAASALLVLNRTDHVYGLQGLRERLLEIHSLQIKGWRYEKTMTKFGEAMVRFRIDQYFERPNKRHYTGYGFSSDGDGLKRVTSTEVYCDGKTAMYIQHKEKKAILGPVDSLDAELAVEEQLQGNIADQLVQGLPDRFECIGTERIGEVGCNLYASVESLGNSLQGDTLQFRTKLWLNPANGMPVRLEYFNVQGDDVRPWIVFEEIVVNGTQPKNLFALNVPEGYERIEPPVVADTTPLLQVRSSGTTGDIWHSAAVAFRIDDCSLLFCWSQRADMEEGRQWFDVPPEFELQGEGLKSRECDEFTLHTDALEDHQWRWSLLLPKDRGQIGLNVLSMTNHTEEGGTVSSSSVSLTFPPARLAEVIVELQRRTLGSEGNESSIWTLERIRKKLRELGVEH